MPRHICKGFSFVNCCSEQEESGWKRHSKKDVQK